MIRSFSFSRGVRRFLEAADRFGVVATVDPEGSPHQAVVWFLVEEDGIVLNSRAGRQWPTHLLRDPRVSIMVADGYDYVIVNGRAELVDDGERALGDIKAMARRYGSDEAQFDGQHRLSFLVRPDRVATHGEVDA